MKKLNPSLLAIAIANTGIAIADNHPGQANLPTPLYHYARQVPVNPFYFQGPMTNTANWNGFIKGSHLSTLWRAAYFNYDYKHASKSMGATTYTNPDWKQPAVGAMIDGMSGYADGWFGINASLYGDYKLDATGPGPRDWLIRTNNKHKYQNSYGNNSPLSFTLHHMSKTSSVSLTYRQEKQ